MPARPAMTPPTPTRARQRSNAGVSRRLTWAVVIGPSYFVYLALSSYLVNAVQLVGLAVAVSLGALMVRRPERTLWLLVVILPFQTSLSSLLYRVLPDRGVVRMAGLWKEVAFGALVIAAWTAATRAQRRLDRLDRLCLAYVALGTVYLVAGGLLGSSVGAAVSVDLRFACWRGIVLPVALFLAARHLRIGKERVTGLLRAVKGLAVVIGCTALVEIAVPGVWTRFLVEVIGLNRYRSEVLDSSGIFLLNVGDDLGSISLGGYSLPQIGGLMASSLTLAFLALVVIGVLGEELIRRERPGAIMWPFAFVVIGLAATQTRSAIVGLGVATMAALQPSAGRSSAGRVRFALLAAVVVIVSIPLLAASGGLDRFFGGASSSDRDHRFSTRSALEQVIDEPFGHGLGGGAQGSLSGQPGAIVAENQFLDIALQLGIVGGLLAAAIGVAIVVRLRRVAATVEDSELRVLGLGMRNVFIGLLVPCFLLQPFLGPEVGWVVLVLAGAALGALERAADQDEPPVPRFVVGPLSKDR